jgi:transmembrane sensor
MSQPNSPGDRTADAIDCFTCLTDPEADPRLRARWTAWLGESAENRAAYQSVRETWSRPVPNDLWPSHEEIVSDTYDGDGPIPAQGRKTGAGGAEPTTPARAWPNAPPLAWVAASLFAAVVIIAGWQRLRSEDRQVPNTIAYQTGRGEIRRVALADGSSITLGPFTTINITETPSSRTARLDGGEALLSIVHDRARPFKLLANGGEIDDIGTTFGVKVKPDRVTVTVVDGVVSVSVENAAQPSQLVMLQHNRQVSFGRELDVAVDVDGRAETEWVRGRLAYVDQPLANVAADLTRYTTHDIVIADQAAGALRYTGTIEADAIDQWIAALTRVYPVSVERNGSRLILRSSQSK